MLRQLAWTDEEHHCCHLFENSLRQFHRDSMTYNTAKIMESRRRSANVDESTNLWKQTSVSSGKFGQRHILVVMLTACFLVFHFTRAQFAITLIKMVQGIILSVSVVVS